MSEEMEQQVTGDEPQDREYVRDATGSMIPKTTAEQDRKFNTERGTPDDWRDNLK